MISVSVAGLVVDEAELTVQITESIQQLVGIEAVGLAEQISTWLTSDRARLGVLGVVSLVVTASMLFVALQDALEVIWEQPVGSAADTIRRRLLAIAIVLLTGVVLLTVFLLHLFSASIRDLAPGNSSIGRVLTDALASVASWVMAGIIVAWLFRQLVRHHPSWRSSLVGGLATAFALAIGSRIVGWYFDVYGANSLGGATGSLFVIVIWIYAIGQIMLAGAELTRAIELTPGD